MDPLRQPQHQILTDHLKQPQRQTLTDHLSQHQPLTPMDLLRHQSQLDPCLPMEILLQLRTLTVHLKHNPALLLPPELLTPMGLLFQLLTLMVLPKALT